MENGPSEDVLPVKNGDIPASYVCLPEGISFVSIFLAIFFGVTLEWDLRKKPDQKRHCFG